jgi:hypothetical protein
MAQDDYVVAQGRIVLMKLTADKYCPALINKVNADGTVDLTTFLEKGVVDYASGIKRGAEIGQWAPPGVDSKK